MGIWKHSLLKRLTRSLRTRIIAWFFIPTAIILAAVALVNFFAYQKVTEELVIERDRDLTRLSAGQLATELSDFSDILSELARTADFLEGRPDVYRSALERDRGLLVVFDGGVLILDNFGIVIAATTELPGLVGQNWSDRSFFRQAVRSRDPVFSDILSAEPNDKEIIAVAVPITGSNGEFLGSVVGTFRLGATGVSALYGEILKLRIGQSGSVYIVDGNGRIIYHSDTVRIGSDFSGQPIVQQLLSRRTGAIRTRNVDEEDIVAGFAPVPGTPWGLVNEESWSELTSGAQGFQSKFLLLFVALGVAIPVVFVTVGLSRFMRPIQDLIQGAQQITAGNFQHKIIINSGDEILELAEQFNTMAGALRDSYSELEQRVADRTSELQESQERLSSVITGAPVILFALDQKAIITFSEGAGLDTIDLNVEEVVGKSASDVERIMPLLVEDVNFALAGETSTSEVEVATATFETRYSPIFDSNGNVVGLIGVATDITERKQAENALFQQERDMAVLAERNRMAREIHDTLAQGFTGIVLQLEAGEQSVGDDDDAFLNHIRRAKGLARDSLQEARRSVWNLLPRALEEEPLEVVLQEEVNRFAESEDTKADFHLSGEYRELPSPVQASLLRICQEALHNIRKYAHATEVTVRLEFSTGYAIMRIQDNGVGFDVTSLQAPGLQGGFGLKGMEQRAYLVNGTMSITSEIGNGTMIEVKIPVH